MSKRYFEYRDDKSAKFWEIEVSGAQHTVRYGKIGTSGQTQVKAFADAGAAQKAAEKLIAEKAGKGYQEGIGNDPPSGIEPSAAKSKLSSSAVPKSGSRVLASIQTEANVKIERSSKVEKHNAEMQRLRNEVLEYIASHKKLASDGFSKTSSTAANLKKAFVFFDESFALERKLIEFVKVDRCASMLCGPFFTSKSYPQPKHADQFLIPFVQLDLDWVNRGCGKALPSGLLQVWLGQSGAPVIRVIPPQEVSKNTLTEFCSDELMLNEAVTLIPTEWGFPHSATCSQITSLSSIGITSPGLNALCNCDYEEHEELMELIDAIEENQFGVQTNKKSRVPDAHLFGRFAPYQTSVTDYPNCQMVFDAYGICGAGKANLLLHDTGRWELVVCYR